MNRLTPIKAIREKCIDCSGGFAEVRNCPCFEDKEAIEICFLYFYRLGQRPKTKASLTPVKSIRKYCLWCQGSNKGIKGCLTTDCFLYKYRMGKNPARKGIKTDYKMPFFYKKSAVETGKNSEKEKEKENIKLLLEKK